MAINPLIIWELKPKSISSFLAGFKSATNTPIDNAIDPGLDLYPHLGKFNPGSAVYLYCPVGYGKTKLNNNFLETKLKLSASTLTGKLPVSF